MNIVVGSGPSGVMAAQALLDAGLPVTLVDAGSELEAPKKSIVSRLAQTDPAQWAPGLVAQVSGYAHEPGAKVPLKLSFGSRFPYSDDEMRTLAQQGTKCLQSSAKGGLSNLWGAAVLPHTPDDFAGWPVTLADMAPHYARAAEAMRISAAHDGLEEIFPLYAPAAPPAKSSRQAEKALATMRRNSSRLARGGFRFGQSRLALRTEDDSSGKACLFSGLCLSGCPYGAIWNSSQLLDRLVSTRGLTYRPRLRATRVSSTAGEATLSVRNLDTGAEEILSAERVFLACGPVSTARLVAFSRGWHDREIAMQYQPYFLLPVMSFAGTPDVETERLHTLAQAFIELEDASVSARRVHLQLYGYDEHIRDALARVCRLLGPFSGAARRALAGRLMFLQGYLHSDEAAGISLRTAADGTARLSATAAERTRRVVGRAARKIAAHSRNFGFLPLLPMLRVGVPGEGNHIGGSFPMRERPGELETDRLGRLPGLPRVHLVDASVLTNLAATTFTYTTMANAHRIASEAAAEGA